MPRPIRCRRIRGRPSLNYFKPAGVPIRNLEKVVLTLDEYEAVRLIDLEEVEQIEAAEKMNVSQPTLSRLLKAGRKKMSEAIVRGKAIKIEGGVVKIGR